MHFTGVGPLENAADDDGSVVKRRGSSLTSAIDISRKCGNGAMAIGIIFMKQPLSER